MPKLDKTGPQGLGSQTGRGLGYCSGGFGRFGRGLCRGFGFNRPFREPTTKEEKEILNSELECLREDIKEIEKRLKELN